MISTYMSPTFKSQKYIEYFFYWFIVNLFKLIDRLLLQSLLDVCFWVSSAYEMDQFSKKTNIITLNYHPLFHKRWNRSNFPVSFSKI